MSFILWSAGSGAVLLRMSAWPFCTRLLLTSRRASKSLDYAECPVHDCPSPKMSSSSLTPNTRGCLLFASGGEVSSPWQLDPMKSGVGSLLAAAESQTLGGLFPGS